MAHRRMNEWCAHRWSETGVTGSSSFRLFNWLYRQLTMRCLSCAVHHPSIVHQQSADEMLESTLQPNGQTDYQTHARLFGFVVGRRGSGLASHWQSLGPPPNLANCSQTNALASLRHCLSPLPLGVPFDPSLYPLGSGRYK